jgi:ferredoxin
MAYVITDACAGVKDTACVEICPVDCIHPTPKERGFSEATQLYIDPDACIDCGMCVDVCPPRAIYAGDELPPGKERFAQLNAEWFKRAK